MTADSFIEALVNYTLQQKLQWHKGDDGNYIALAAGTPAERDKAWAAWLAENPDSADVERPEWDAHFRLDKAGKELILDAATWDTQATLTGSALWRLWAAIEHGRVPRDSMGERLDQIDSALQWILPVTTSASSYVQVP